MNSSMAGISPPEAHLTHIPQTAAFATFSPMLSTFPCCIRVYPLSSCNAAAPGVFLSSAASLPSQPSQPLRKRSPRRPRSGPRSGARSGARSSGELEKSSTQAPQETRDSSAPAVHGSIYEQVVAAVPLSHVFREIQGDRAMRQNGSDEYMVVCPFHDDKNPSLSINDARRVYNCFGCGAKGNLFTLEMWRSGVESVPEAVDSLATRYPRVADILERQKKSPGSFSRRRTTPVAEEGARIAPLTSFRTPIVPSSRKWGETLRYRRTNMAVLKATQEYFFSEFKKSEEANKYLEMRGVSRSAREGFGFGFAPGEEMTSCLNMLVGMGFSERDCTDAGVAKIDKLGRVYDTFRERLMLPIRDGDGNVISFSGRLLHDSETAPKYINGPGSSVFEKRKILFGLDMVGSDEDSSALREYGKVVLVEGYMDAIALHDKSGGKVAAVASMGTAVSDEQIRAGLQVLRDRVEGKLIINLDGDDAGLSASIRLCENVLPLMNDVSCVYIARPPAPFKDVGEYLESEGTTVDSYVSHLDETALHWIEWRVAGILQDVLDARDAEGSAVQVAQAAELGAMGNGDDADEEYLYGPEGILGRPASLSESMRRESLLLLRSMEGETGGNGSKDDNASGSRDGSISSKAEQNVTFSAKSKRQRRMARLALARSSIMTSHSDVGTSDEVDDDEPRIADCPVSVIERLTVFVSKALRVSPGLNLPWLVHRWSDTLSGTNAMHVPVLYEDIMKRIDEHSASWVKNSPARMIHTMPPPPWVIDELPKSRRLAVQGKPGKVGEATQMSMSTFLQDKRRVKGMIERLELQERFMIPHLERRRAPASKRLRSNPRASAEEMILRTLIRAKGDQRLDALDELVAVMIDVELAKLLPFWTSTPRTELFTYLVDLEVELSVEEMAAECEVKPWWDEEIELLFVPYKEFGDDELESIRKLELSHPVTVVKQTAGAVQEMAAKVATGRAVEQLGEYLATHRTDGRPGGDQQITQEQMQNMMEAVTGMAFKTPKERAMIDKVTARQRKERLDKIQMEEIERKLISGESLGDWDTYSNSGTGGEEGLRTELSGEGSFGEDITIEAGSSTVPENDFPPVDYDEYVPNDLSP